MILLLIITAEPTDNFSVRFLVFRLLGGFSFCEPCLSCLPGPSWAFTGLLPRAGLQRGVQEWAGDPGSRREEAFLGLRYHC